jgi:co-chaperonin GroES (HSP10)
LICEDKVYKIIPYQDLYVAKRKSYAINVDKLPPSISARDFLDEWKRGGDILLINPYSSSSSPVATELSPLVIPLNGYCLLKQIHYKSLSPLDVTSEEKVDKTKGEVAYVGNPNKRYKNERYTDFKNLREGDVVLFDKKTTPFLLERQLYASRFDPDNLYWIVQRRGIAMVI